MLSSALNLSWYLGRSLERLLPLLNPLHRFLKNTLLDFRNIISILISLNDLKPRWWINKTSPKIAGDIICLICSKAFSFFEIG